MPNDQSEWELAPENAHPRAQELLKDSYFWESADDDAPLGNDRGADTLHLYRSWRAENPSDDSRSFIDEVLTEWEVTNRDWFLLDETALQDALSEDHFSVLVRDDFVIGLAFSQLVLEGKIDPEVRELALGAIKRQAMDTVISFREWVDPAERRERLAQMAGILEAV